MPHFVLELRHALRRRFELGLAVARHAVAEELAVPWSVHRAFGGVDPQFELLFHELRHAGEHPLPSRLGLYVDVAVGGVSLETLTALLQLFIQIIQQDVGEQWGERAS